MPRRVSKLTMRLEVLVSPEQYDFLKNELNGGIGYNVRRMIDAAMEHHDEELASIEKEFANMEPRYVSLKKKIEELRQQKKKMEEEQ